MRQRRNRYRREAWIAVRREEIDFCHEAKKKSISPWGVNRREAWRNRFFAVRQRRNRYRREEKSISRRRKNWYRREEKSIIASKKKSILRQRKIDIATKKNRLLRWRKNRYCGEGRIRCCWEFISNTGAPLKRRAKAETVSLRATIYGTLRSSERQKVWSKDLFLMTSSIKVLVCT